MAEQERINYFANGDNDYDDDDDDDYDKVIKMVIKNTRDKEKEIKKLVKIKK